MVGGAVRDQLLGLEIKDRDWVVTGSTPKQMIELGFRPVGKDFPVFLHPETGEEYALARTERKVGRGYRGFEFVSDPGVTLEQDLMRRDLTINAIAEDSSGNLIDPWGGQRDIESRTLRHTSAAFVEDPVRILRIARFAARFSDLGFTLSSNTRSLMEKMVKAGEVDTLVAERVWQELHAALQLNGFPRFIEVLRGCDALAIIFPEIDALFGIPQTAKYHPEIDTGVHVMLALEAAIRTGANPRELFAVLVHDLGKALTPKDQLPSHRGHERRGIKPVNALCDRLRVPRDFRQLALKVCEFHLLMHQLRELRSVTVLKLLENLDAFRKSDELTAFLTCCRADMRGRKGQRQHPYQQGGLLLDYFIAASSVNSQKIAANYESGNEIQKAIRRARIAAIEMVKSGDSSQKPRS